MRRKHLDPVLHRALANKEKQRPVSMFVLGKLPLNNLIIICADVSCFLFFLGGGVSLRNLINYKVFC